MLLLRAPLIFPRSEAGDAEAGPDWSSPHNPVSPADGVGHLAPPASPHLTSPRDLPADRVRDLGGRVRAQPQPGGGGGLCESLRVTEVSQLGDYGLTAAFYSPEKIS